MPNPSTSASNKASIYRQTPYRRHIERQSGMESGSCPDSLRDVLSLAALHDGLVLGLQGEQADEVRRCLRERLNLRTFFYGMPLGENPVWTPIKLCPKGQPRIEFQKAHLTDLIRSLDEHQVSDSILLVGKADLPPSLRQTVFCLDVDGEARRLSELLVQSGSGRPESDLLPTPLAMHFAGTLSGENLSRIKTSREFRTWLSSIGPSLRSQAIRIPGPVGSGVSPQTEELHPRKLQEPQGGMAPAAVKIKFPAGVKTKVFEAVVAQGTGIGYKYELAVSGEIKVQQHGDIQWWSDPANGVVEYEKQVQLWGSEAAVSLLSGFEIEGISSDPTKAPSIKVMVFGFEVGSKSEKIYVKAPNVWVYEFETKTEFKRDGVDYVLELSNELTVTLLPKEQLKTAYRRVLVTSKYLATLAAIAWGVKLATAAMQGLSTIAEVMKIILTRAATVALPFVILTPELSRLMESPGSGPGNVSPSI